MKKSAAGFSVIELVITVAIMGILLGLGAPAYTTYMHNARLRAAGQSFLSGVQHAQSEAVGRNANVDFVLTAGDYTGANFATVAASTTGQNWFIRTSDLVTLIEGKFGSEGGGGSAGASSPVSVSGTVSSVTFNGLGSTSLAAAATFQFTNPTGGACAPTGAMRCLNVVVSVGGQSRICDPAATAGDTRAC